MLCIRLSVAGDKEPELETLNEILKDQLTVCGEVAERFGGHINGALDLKGTGTPNGSLIGRNAELSSLHTFWQETVKGNSHSLLLTGDAGIGKSRLVRELQRFVARTHHSLKEGRCLPEHKNNALFPVIQMIRSHLNIQKEKPTEEVLALLEETLRRVGCEMEQAMPVLSAWFALPLPERYAPSELSPDRQTSILMETLLALFHEMGDGAPLLLVFEDLHWADPTTLSFLGDLLATPGHQTFVLLTSRLDHLGPARETLQLASVIGREFDYDLLTKASLVDESTLQSRCDEEDTEQIAVVAAHHAGAGQFNEAVLLGTKAARSLLNKSVHSEAISHTDLVLEWLPHLPPCGESPERDAPSHRYAGGIC